MLQLALSPPSIIGFDLRPATLDPPIKIRQGHSHRPPIVGLNYPIPGTFAPTKGFHGWKKSQGREYFAGFDKVHPPPAQFYPCHHSLFTISSRCVSPACARSSRIRSLKFWHEDGDHFPENYKECSDFDCIPMLAVLLCNCLQPLVLPPLRHAEPLSRA
jgi:hypothetical protein